MSEVQALKNYRDGQPLAGSIQESVSIKNEHASISCEKELQGRAMTGRARDFLSITNALRSATRAMTGNALLIEGDSLELIRRIPSHSISLILTDPPYHATKKRNIVGDTAFEEDHHYLEWMD